MTYSDRFEQVDCGLCGSSLNTTIYRYCLGQDVLNIVKCRNCGCIYLTPRPRSDKIGEFYQDDYYSFKIDTGNADEQISAKDAFRYTVMKHHFGYAKIDSSKELPIPPRLSALFRSFVAVPHYREAGRLLDVGCGAGQKLLEFRALGWDVRGAELSEQAVAAARKMGLDVARTDVAHSPWPAESFSAVTFYHSLEHLPSPRLALRESFRLLEPGGELLVAVPNFGCLERKLFGRNWNWLEVPRHFYHFTRASLTRVVAETGFKVEWVGFSPFGGSAGPLFPNTWPKARMISDKMIRAFATGCAMAGSGKALIVSARK